MPQCVWWISLGVCGGSAWVCVWWISLGVCGGSVWVCVVDRPGCVWWISLGVCGGSASMCVVDQPGCVWWISLNVCGGSAWVCVVDQPRCVWWISNPHSATQGDGDIRVAAGHLQASPHTTHLSILSSRRINRWINYISTLPNRTRVEAMDW